MTGMVNVTVTVCFLIKRTILINSLLLFYFCLFAFRVILFSRCTSVVLNISDRSKCIKPCFLFHETCTQNQNKNNDSIAQIISYPFVNKFIISVFVSI